MKYFLGAVGLTTLFLGGLSVMNVMLVAVRERTREIGVRKAVGAQSRDIMMQFFIETIIVVAWQSPLASARCLICCLCRNFFPDYCRRGSRGPFRSDCWGWWRFWRQCIPRGRPRPLIPLKLCVTRQVADAGDDEGDHPGIVDGADAQPHPQLP